MLKLQIYQIPRLRTPRAYAPSITHIFPSFLAEGALNFCLDGLTGSHGDWLIVRSRTRELTVYIKRDNATLVSERSPSSDSYQTIEGHWKQLEAEVAESLLKVGLTGVTVSVRDEVLYLDGQVRTDQERFRAQSAARSVPGVQTIRNRIMLVP